jgi:hypothetical protein
LNVVFVTNTVPHSRHGLTPILSTTRKRLPARFSCPTITMRSTRSS